MPRSVPRPRKPKPSSHHPEALKIYLSAPMIANRQLERAKIIAKAISDSGHEVTSPWVLGSVEGVDPSVVNIFERDMGGAERCDAIVADVSQPSIGVGMEIMAAYKAGKRIFLVAMKGSTISRMLLHMKKKTLIEFVDEEALYSNLVRTLKAKA